MLDHLQSALVSYFIEWHSAAAAAPLQLCKLQLPASLLFVYQACWDELSDPMSAFQRLIDSASHAFHTVTSTLPNLTAVDMAAFSQLFRELLLIDQADPDSVLRAHAAFLRISEVRPQSRPTESWILPLPIEFQVDSPPTALKPNMSSDIHFAESSEDEEMSSAFQQCADERPRKIRKLGAALAPSSTATATPVAEFASFVSWTVLLGNAHARAQCWSLFLHHSSSPVHHLGSLCRILLHSSHEFAFSGAACRPWSMRVLRCWSLSRRPHLRCHTLRIAPR
jgi:hypothetical protein